MGDCLIPRSGFLRGLEPSIKPHSSGESCDIMKKGIITMLFYKVIKGDKHDHFTGYTTVKGELVTQKERDTKFRYLMDDCFLPVEVSKKKTYWFFGARFEQGTVFEG